MASHSGGAESRPGRFRFGDIEVDAASHGVTRAGEPQQLEPKAFAVLLALLERPGELVPRDELLDQVWGHRHVTPGVLTRAIAQLRAALGDDHHHPRYIQTRHALGYAFIGEMEPVAATPQVPAERAVPGPDPPSALPSGDDAAPVSPAANHRLSWMPWAVVVLALVAVLSWIGGRERGPPRPAEASVAILPFVSLGGGGDDDYFAQGLALEMHDALAGVEGLKIAAQLSPASDSGLGSDAKAIGQLLDVATVLEATVRRDGERLRINARLTDCASGYTLWSRSYDQDLADVFATQAAIAADVVDSLRGILPGERDALAARLAPTRSTVAFDAYLRGLQELQLSRESGSVDGAVVHFQRALEEDVGFARAQSAICRSELVRFGNRRDANAFDNARRACVRAREMDPQASEVDLAFGDLHRVRGEYDEAIEYYRRALRDPARAVAAYVGTAQVHAARGERDLSREYFGRAIELGPGNAGIYGRLGYQQYLAGELDEAIDSYRRATQLRPDSASFWSSLGGVHIAAGNNDEAEKALERSLRIQPTVTVLGNYAELKFQQGDYAGAAALLRRALELDPNDFLSWGRLADALLADPDTADLAREPFQRAAEMARRYLEIRADDARATAVLGWYLANLGEPDEAREQVLRAESLAGERGETALINARTLSLVGSEDELLKRVAAAREAGIPEQRIRSDEVLGKISAVVGTEPGRRQ